MEKIKKLFAEFRSSTPKHIQWLLLAAAFVVVIILLTLIIGHKSDKEVAVVEEQLKITVSPKEIDLTGVLVDQKNFKEIEVKVNKPVSIDNIEVANGSSELVLGNDCDNLTDSCLIRVTYKPTAIHVQDSTQLNIVWHQSTNEAVSGTETITIKYSAEKEPEPIAVPEPEPEPAPVVESKPEPKPEPVPEPEPEPVVEPDPIEPIVGEDIFAEPEEEFVLPSAGCSDFAIAGYDQSGKQIGWIKPERGANYFYPLSDKGCKNATGKYDQNTGIITSLEDGKRIGTDSDHIGYRHIKARNITVPELTNPTNSADAVDGAFSENAIWASGGMKKFSDGEEWLADWSKQAESLLGSGAAGGESITNSMPYDRTFILRQFKPIPATIVSEVRADPSVYGCSTGACNPEENHSIPVRATVDRNVYSDDGRTIIIPTGTLLMGYLEGNLPGPYQTIGRMNIKWYQFIRPDGVEFNFGSVQDPYSGDAQGRVGVPGHGSTDYLEQMVMPVLTAIVPAAVNMIAPIADTFVNQIDLDNNTVVQSGTVRSSEMAKQELISAWNKVAQKLLVDAIDNTVPPFSIAAGTRINVYSPIDLILTCGDGDTSKKCAFAAFGSGSRRAWAELKNNVTIDKTDSSWIGQVRSFDMDQYCEQKNNKWTIGSNWKESGSDYRTVLIFCESKNYKAINEAKNDAYRESQNNKGIQGVDKDGNHIKLEKGTQEYNEQVLGLQYDDNGFIANPWEQPAAAAPEEAALTCDDGTDPDANGCCTGETYTDMGEQGFNCCPDAGGDCFPPITAE